MCASVGWGWTETWPVRHALALEKMIDKTGSLEAAIDGSLEAAIDGSLEAGSLEAAVLLNE